MDAAKAELVLRRLAEGLSLRKACEEAEITHRAVLNWRDADVAGFAIQYARAREIGYQVRADELIDIADTPQLGEIRTVKPDGSVEVKYADMIEHRRLRIDARKWELSKMLPKLYGDKIGHEVTGPNGGPLQTVTRIELAPLTPAPK